MCNILEIEEVLDFKDEDEDEDRKFDINQKFQVILKKSKNPFLNFLEIPGLENQLRITKCSLINLIQQVNLLPLVELFQQLRNSKVFPPLSRIKE
jgi:hypothetical protein